MKIRILPLIAIAMIAASTFFSSCLKSDYQELDLPSVSSIKSFSLGTLRQTIYGGSSEGKDTIDTISYAKHPFVIDQINRKIYNPDSLPKGVDISKALVNIKADGNVFYLKNDEDTILTPTDSLDLTKELSLKVLTYSPVYKDFRFGKPYTLTVNVHKYNPDSLVWSHSENINFGASLSEQKAVYADNHLYVFGKDNQGTKVYKLNVEKGYIRSSNWEEVTPSGTDININSAIAYNNEVYYIASNNLYKQFSPVENLNNLSTLISATKDSILAYTTDNKIISIDKDGYAGTKTSTSEFEFNNRFSAVSYQAEHNTKLWKTTVMSNAAAADTTANVFSYISSENNMGKLTPNNPVTCPNLDNISMIRYDGKLYAFGGKREDKIKAFENFYYSNNNGFDWRIEPNKYMKFETEKLTELYADKPYSCVVETDSEGKESFIWFIWHDGKISRAHLNKFAPKN